MSKFRNIIVYSFLIIFMMITARYLFFISVLEANKDSFRKEATVKGLANTIFINKAELYIDTKDINWKDNNQEIEINRQIFEILSIKKTNNGYLLKIVLDTKESNCLSYLTNLNEPKKAPLKDLFNFFAQLSFYDSSNVYVFHNFNFNNGIVQLRDHLFLTTNFRSELIKPPCFI